MATPRSARRRTSMAVSSSTRVRPASKLTARGSRVAVALAAGLFPPPRSPAGLSERAITPRPPAIIASMSKASNSVVRRQRIRMLAMMLSTRINRPPRVKAHPTRERRSRTTRRCRRAADQGQAGAVVAPAAAPVSAVDVDLLEQEVQPADEQCGPTTKRPSPRVPDVAKIVMPLT
jgi:hypothetical protein